MLTEAAVAPPFTARDQDGNEVSLDDLAGTWVVVWWYPKAATPG